MKVKSICILGGGTSGFAMSAALARYRELSGIDFDIQVVYSKSIGSIGVGESTILEINKLLDYLGLEDKDWMKECNATYKTSIRFEDFYKKGRYFHYPFGEINKERNNPSVLNEWFIKKDTFPDIYTPERAATFFIPHTILAEKNKLFNNSDYDLKKNTAYHFDSHLLGKFLEKYSKKRGVKVVEDNFYGISPHEDGSIKSLVCDRDIYSADLFIDCSGFRSLLLGTMMGEKYISYSDTLINNKVLRAEIPYKNKEKELKNYTNCVALKNGWCWEIPLWDKMSVGYVHTNRFADEKEIEQEFFEHVGEVEYDTIEFKTGRYERGWVKNVVAVGLSYGFVEPLESTGIATTLINIFKVLEGLSKRDMNYTQIDRDVYNYDVPRHIDGFKSFVGLHYNLSSRDDSDYWRYVTEGIDYRDELVEGITTYTYFLHNTTYYRAYCEKYNRSPGCLFVAAGMNYSCFSKAEVLALDKGNTEEFEQYIRQLEENVERLPSTLQYLKENIY